MPYTPCERCGGVLRRSHRNFFERLFFSEAYRCEGCGRRKRKRAPLGSFFTLKYAHYVKCPRCHSVDLTVLKKRDHIDQMQPGVLNFIHKLGGAKLYHCWFCRLQFYDLRPRYNSDKSALASEARDDSPGDLKAAS